MNDDRALYLIGFMGSGKTEVGLALAERLGWEFIDTDRLVEQNESRSIERIFQESGEGYFREAEWRALQSLAGRRRRVVATGGGLFLGTLQRRFIKEHGRSIWLDVELEVAVRRVDQGADRPLWMPRNRLAFRAFFERRRAVYALADLRIEASQGDPAEVARRVLERIWAVLD